MESSDWSCSRSMEPSRIMESEGEQRQTTKANIFQIDWTSRRAVLDTQAQTLNFSIVPNATKMFYSV